MLPPFSGLQGGAEQAVVGGELVAQAVGHMRPVCGIPREDRTPCEIVGGGLRQCRPDLQFSEHVLEKFDVLLRGGHTTSQLPHFIAEHRVET